ncbi:hypothetical protein KY290_005302 [Solanum tuberosum]|uniref:Uncharacterized protein n=1 Tax=Solanum tuberosum TaxID=4113 RepID=A0ABQ7WFV5_SOLTU|nr:hypothetical protein KY289_005692 [Solanum tuberosum]KAH0778875.1 hypothetical protein KY290_005302 [Solanum tuberosum]
MGEKAVERHENISTNNSFNVFNQHEHDEAAIMEEGLIHNKEKGGKWIVGDNTTLATSAQGKGSDHNNVSRREIVKQNVQSNAYHIVLRDSKPEHYDEIMDARNEVMDKGYTTQITLIDTTHGENEALDTQNVLEHATYHIPMHIVDPILDDIHLNIQIRFY